MKSYQDDISNQISLSRPKSKNNSRPISVSFRNSVNNNTQFKVKNNHLNPYLSNPKSKNTNLTNFFNRLNSSNQITKSGKLESEKLYEDCMNLKVSLNKISKELRLTKSEVVKRDEELKKQEKVIKDIYNDSNNHFNDQMKNSKYSLTVNSYITNLKNQYKELKSSFAEKDAELKDLKRTLKYTKLKEIQLENETLQEEMGRLKNNYEYLLIQNLQLEKMKKEHMILQDNFNRQEKLLNNLHNARYNGSLTIIKENETNNQDTNLNKNQNKESGRKNKRILELEKELTQITSKYEYENKLLKDKIKILEEKLSNSSKRNNKLNFNHTSTSRSNTHPNNDIIINTNSSKISSPTYKNSNFFTNNNLLNDDEIKEFTYMLLKSMEGRMISYEQLKEIILSDSISNTSNDLLEILANKLIILLKLKNIHDKNKILSYIRSIQKTLNQDNSDIIEVFLSYFKDLSFYSEGEKKKYARMLQKNLANQKANLLSAFQTYDLKRSGLITFINFKKIFQQLNLSIQGDLIEFIIYLMKKTENESINIDLEYMNYNNLIQVLDENNLKDESQELTASLENKFQLEGENSRESEDVILSIQEFNESIDKILSKLAEFLITHKKKVRELFNNQIFTHSKTPNELIEVISLKDFIVSLQNFGLVINTTDIYCIFTKLKFDDEHEMVDLAKLVEEMGNYGIFEDNTDSNSKTLQKEENENMKILITDSQGGTNSNFIQKLNKYLNENDISLNDFLNPINDKIQFINMPIHGLTKYIKLIDIELLLQNIGIHTSEIDPELLESQGNLVNLTSVAKALKVIKRSESKDEDYSLGFDQIEDMDIEGISYKDQ